MLKNYNLFRQRIGIFFILIEIGAKKFSIQ